MKIDGIKSEICNMIKDRFVFEDNTDFENELFSLADEDLEHKGILRIKRQGIRVDKWKTIVLIEIDADNNEIKAQLKKAMSWLAAVKESLLGTESADLYLFLSFNGEIYKGECIRIESTEQLCRKYVLMPDEQVPEFLNRTFLQKLVNIEVTTDYEDPLERAFSETAAQYSWLTPEVQQNWKKAFSDFSGSDLVDVLVGEEELA